MTPFTIRAYLRTPVIFNGYMTLDALRKAGVPVFAYGHFLTVSLNFFILAFIVFLMVKQINHLKRKQQGEAVTLPIPPTPEDIVLLREIRDNLKNRTL